VALPPPSQRQFLLNIRNLLFGERASYTFYAYRECNEETKKDWTEKYGFIGKLKDFGSADGNESMAAKEC
jgi:hypothetical protein